MDRKASIVSSIYQDVSPTRPKENISPAPSQHSFIEPEPTKVVRAESLRNPGGNSYMIMVVTEAIYFLAKRCIPHVAHR